jgi:hypothetical protein
MHFLWTLYQSHSSMKNSVSTFCALDAKTQVWHNVAHHTFSGIHTSPAQACKVVHRRFVPRTHQNALHDPHILPDAKIHVCHNVSQRAFYGILRVPPEQEK